MSLTELQIEKASQWAADFWADKLQKGDKEKFHEILKAKIIEEFKKEDGRLNIENDYDPQGILLDAVREIGIDCQGFFFSGNGIFPRKHSTDFHQDKNGNLICSPKEGYGNFLEIIVFEKIDHDLISTTSNSY